MTIGSWLAREQIGVLFGAGEIARKGAAQGMIWYSLCLPFFGVSRICSSYFCATAQAKMANILAFTEPLLVQPFFLFVLPFFFGVQGIWAAVLASYVLLAAIALWMLYQELQVMPE